MIASNVFSNGIAEVKNRFEQINRLEKKTIGKINRQVNRLTIERRHLERISDSGNTANIAKIEKIDARLESLQAEFEVLAAEARELRQLQASETLEYKLASGQTRTQILGDFVGFHRPNDMSIFEKIGYFLHHIWSFLSERPREANTEGGIFPAIFGTVMMVILMAILVTPLGVIAAVYLREYAKQGALIRIIRIAVNNLAGVPSIVYGVFGLGFFVYFLGGNIDALFFPEALPSPTFGTPGLMWSSLTLASPAWLCSHDAAATDWAPPKPKRCGVSYCRWQVRQS